MGLFNREQPEPYNEMAEQSVVHAQTQQSSLAANQSRRLNYEMDNTEKSFADAQLECEQTLSDISHLLKQDVYQWDEDKQIMDWFSIDDEKKRVLTNEGVDKIMQIMKSYINKETLLSNFDEKMIMRRMLEFSLALSAMLFMKYEIYFRTPTLNECYDILENRLRDKLGTREMRYKLRGEDFPEEKERLEILKEIDGREEYEIKKIRSETRKLNLREFEMIFTQLRALIESTHNRAWKGEERGSLRRHVNINEVIGGGQQQPQKRKWGMF